MPAFSLTLYPKYASEYAVITFDSNGGTIINDIVVLKNELVTLVTPERIGHTFIGWYESNNFEKKVPNNTSFSEDMNLVARWYDDTYDSRIDKVFNEIELGGYRRGEYIYQAWIFVDENTAGVYDFGAVYENKTYQINPYPSDNNIFPNSSEYANSYLYIDALFFYLRDENGPIDPVNELGHYELIENNIYYFEIVLVVSQVNQYPNGPLTLKIISLRID